MSNNVTQDDDSREPSAAELAEQEAELADVSMPANNWERTSSRNLFLRQADYAVAHSKNQWDKDVLRNIRLVIYFAKFYEGKGMSDEDLVQEGIIGLMKAVERHDPQKGKLSTYASWWIKQKIKRALSDQSRDIRLPVNVLPRRKRIRECAIKLETDLGRKPSLDEIAQATRCSLKSIADAYEPKGTVAFSLNAPIEIDGESVVAERVPDRSTLQPDEVLIERENSIEGQKLAILTKLKSLTSVSGRDKEVFTLFNNLDTGVAIYRTLDSVGQSFGITRERVRQILRVVSAKLRLKMNAPESSDNGNNSARAKKVDRMRSVHVRASPAFVNWKPGNPTTDRAVAVLDFVATAYELQVTDILSTKMRGDIEWARGLAATIMLKDLGMHPKEIERSFLGCLGLTRIVIGKIDSIINNDPIVRKDVEGLRSHFKNVIGLQS